MKKQQELRDLSEVEVPLKDLDLKGGPFCMSTGEVPQALLASLERVGLIHPPLVGRGQAGGWDVVTGFRRLRGLRKLGLETVRCADVSEGNRSRFDLLLLALHDNLATRPLNDLETGMALSRLSAFVAPDDLRNTYMPLLGLSRRPGLLEAYLALEEAEPVVKDAVARSRLSLPAFQALRSWAVEDRVKAAQCIVKLNLNFNKQLQFIDILHDLMEIEGRSAQEVLAAGEAGVILEQGQANPPQAAGRLLEHLRRRRLPTVSAAEQAFQRRVAALDLPENVRVLAPPFFEGSVFRLEMTFRSGGELRQGVERLAQTPGLASLGPPWKEEA